MWSQWIDGLGLHIIGHCYSCLLVGVCYLIFTLFAAFHVDFVCFNEPLVWIFFNSLIIA